MSLSGRLAEHIRTTPDAVAVTDGPITMSYRQFGTAVAIAAACIADCAPGAVGLFTPRSAEGVVGYWAVLCSGRTLVPLPPEGPASRIAEIAELAGVSMVLCSGRPGLLAAPPRPARAPLPGAEVDLSALLLDVLSAPESAAADPAGLLGRKPADPAYILFTSGSTGAPKGVCIPPSALTAYAESANLSLRVGPGARVSHNFDYAFDPSVLDVVVSLANGATVMVPSTGERLRPVAYVNRAELTHWASVPSLISLARRTGSLQPESMPGLRSSAFMGEPLVAAQATAWGSAAHRSQIVNAYGPTELTVTCTEHVTQAGAQEWPQTRNGTVPIGRVYPGLEWGLLDGDDSTGELVVRGSQRLSTYLDPRNNRDRFASRALDGSWRPESSTTVQHDWAYRTGDLVEVVGDVLVHLGRVDRQVKLRGRRVELAEVEAVLRRVLASEAVVAVEGAGESARLVALIANPEPAPHLLAAVADELPGYMVPFRYEAVAELPLDERGKIDHRRARALLGLSPA